VDFTSLRRIHAPFKPSLTSDIDTSYFPTDDLEKIGDKAAVNANAAPEPEPPEDNPDMILPFVGYTFKRFENTFY